MAWRILVRSSARWSAVIAIVASRSADGNPTIMPGSGGPAGAWTAIAAHDAGRSVVVVEPAPRGGGNARYSGLSCADAERSGRAAHLQRGGQEVEFGGTSRVGDPGQQGAGGPPPDLE